MTNSGSHASSRRCAAVVTHRPASPAVSSGDAGLGRLRRGPGGRSTAMRRAIICGLALALAGSVACGKSETEKQLEEAAKQAEAAAKQMEQAADQMGKAAEGAGGDMQKASEDFGKAMAGFASAMAGGDGKTVDVVSFRDLQVALPTVPGWTMEGKAKGEKMTSPVPFSQTEARYTKGDASMEVKVVDSGFSQMLVAPWAMFLTAGYEKETDEGYEKST